MRTEPIALAVAEALGSVDLRGRVRDALRARRPPGREPLLLALGKSASPMLSGALDAYGAKGFSRVISARPRASQPLPLGAPGQDFVCGHPLPDAQSAEAGREILGAVRGLSEKDTVLVLLSGGASAAACAPRAGRSLTDLRALTDELLSRGVDIKTLNEARGRWDDIKLGGLARAARPASVITLASADILGDDEAVWSTLGGAPSFVPGGSMAGAVLARPHDLRAAVISRLCALGWAVSKGPDATDSVVALAERYARGLAGMPLGSAWVAVGEPSVPLPPGAGRGGRAGRLALGVARALAGVTRWSFVACASDGVDGSSGSAGALVTGDTWQRPEGDEAWESYADGDFMRSRGAALGGGPTGINLLDVHVMVRG